MCKAIFLIMGGTICERIERLSYSMQAKRKADPKEAAKFFELAINELGKVIKNLEVRVGNLEK